MVDAIFSRARAYAGLDSLRVTTERYVDLELVTLCNCFSNTAKLFEVVLATHRLGNCVGSIMGLAPVAQWKRPAP
jgi:hypothetical protein